MPTIGEFRETKFWLKNVAEHFGFNDPDGSPGFIYRFEDQEVFIEKTAKGYWTVMGAEYILTQVFEEAEEWLYKQCVAEMEAYNDAKGAGRKD